MCLVHRQNASHITTTETTEQARWTDSSQGGSNWQHLPHATAIWPRGEPAAGIGAAETGAGVRAAAVAARGEATVAAGVGAGVKTAATIVAATVSTPETAAARPRAAAVGAAVRVATVFFFFFFGKRTLQRMGNS